MGLPSSPISQRTEGSLAGALGHFDQKAGPDPRLERLTVGLADEQPGNGRLGIGALHRHEPVILVVCDNHSDGAGNGRVQRLGHELAVPAVDERDATGGETDKGFASVAGRVGGVVDELDRPAHRPHVGIPGCAADVVNPGEIRRSSDDETLDARAAEGRTAGGRTRVRGPFNPRPLRRSTASPKISE